jgi:hypothetical protein
LDITALGGERGASSGTAEVLVRIWKKKKFDVLEEETRFGLAFSG